MSTASRLRFAPSTRALLVLACATPLALAAAAAGCVSDDNAAPSGCTAAGACIDASFGDAALPHVDATTGNDSSTPPRDSGSAVDSATGDDAATSDSGTDANDAASTVDAADAAPIDAAPTPIATNLVSPVTLVQGGGYLYWRSAHQPQVATNDVLGIYEIATGKTTTFTDPTAIEHLYADATYVYWVDQNQDVYRLAHGATSPVKIGTSVDIYGARGMTADATKVYWSENYALGQVRSIPLDAGQVDGGATSSTAETPQLPIPTGLVAAGGKVFVAQDAIDGGIAYLAGDGGAPTFVFPSRPSPTTLATDGTNLIWIEDGSSGAVLVSAPLGGGAITTYTPGTASQMDVAVDGTTVYWIGSNYKTIEKATIGNPASHQTVVPTTTYTIESLTVIGARLYWIDVDNGIVYSGPK